MKEKKKLIVKISTRKLNKEIPKSNPILYKPMIKLPLINSKVQLKFSSGTRKKRVKQNLSVKKINQNDFIADNINDDEKRLQEFKKGKEIFVDKKYFRDFSGNQSRLSRFKYS